jgi:hypothetical protein
MVLPLCGYGHEKDGDCHVMERAPGQICWSGVCVGPVSVLLSLRSNEILSIAYLDHIPYLYLVFAVSVSQESQWNSTLSRAFLEI